MATSNAERFLGVNDALALEMFMGLVYAPFWENTLLFNAVQADAGVGGVALPSQYVASKRVTSGRSHQFILQADEVDPETHTPGTELLGQAYGFDEGNITIDSIVVAHREVPLDQVQISHFDAIAPLGRGMGRALARNIDKRGFIMAAKTAQAASSTHTASGLTIHNGGNVVQRGSASAAEGVGAYAVSGTGAQNFRDDVDQLAYLMDKDLIPEEGRALVITPFIQRVLQQDDKIWDADFNPTPNDMQRRVVGRMAGFDVIGKRTTHLPQDDITAASLGGGLPTKYHHDFTFDGAEDGEPVALAFAGADEGKAGIGYVAAADPKLGPIYSVMIFDERRNTLFMKAQLMIGWDQLYPPCIGGIFAED